MTEQAQRKRIGIFGGSFNPVHTGHICLARQILTAVALDEIWFMVSPLNPFKQDFTDLLPDDVRLELTREALKDEPCMLASDYEFSLPRPSYMWNTLATTILNTALPLSLAQTIGLPSTAGPVMISYSNITILQCILARVTTLIQSHYRRM